MKRILAATLIALAVSAFAYAQSALTGKWQGKTPNGFQVELDLTATEKVLTGTFTRNGQSITIADGKVSRNAFTFNATIGDQTLGFTGEIDGDQIKFWMDRQGPSTAAVLKRAMEVK